MPADVTKVEVRVLDIDEQRVKCAVQYNETDYNGERLLMHPQVFDSGTGAVLASRLDSGNCTPGTGRSDVLEVATKRLGGRNVRMLHTDAAYFNAETIGWCPVREAAITAYNQTVR